MVHLVGFYYKNIRVLFCVYVVVIMLLMLLLRLWLVIGKGKR